MQRSLHYTPSPWGLESGTSYYYNKMVTFQKGRFIWAKIWEALDQDLLVVQYILINFSSAGQETKWRKVYHPLQGHTQ